MARTVYNKHFSDTSSITKDVFSKEIISGQIIAEGEIVLVNNGKDAGIYGYNVNDGGTVFKYTGTDIISVSSAYTGDIINSGDTLNTVFKKIENTIEGLSGCTSGISADLENIKESVGLDEDGKHIPSEGYYISASTTVEGEIKTLDEALKEVNDLINNFSGDVNDKFDEVDDNIEGLTTELERVEEELNKSKVHSEDGSILVTSGEEGTNIEVNVDNGTLVVKDGVVTTNLELKSVEGDEKIATKYEFGYYKDGEWVKTCDTTINIPKDYVIKDAGIVDYNAEDETIIINGHVYEVVGHHAAGKYIVMIVNTKEGEGVMSQMWLNVLDIAEQYKAGMGINKSQMDNYIVEIKISEWQDGLPVDERPEGVPYLMFNRYDSGITVSGMTQLVKRLENVEDSSEQMLHSYVFSGDSVTFQNVVVGQIYDRSGHTINHIQISNDVFPRDKSIDDASIDNNGLVTALDVKDYVKSRIDGDTIYVGDDDIHSVDGGRLDDNSFDLGYDTVHIALKKFDMDFERVGNALGLETSGLTMLNYPIDDVREKTKFMSGSTNVMEALYDLDSGFTTVSEEFAEEIEELSASTEAAIRGMKIYNHLTDGINECSASTSADTITFGGDTYVRLLVGENEVDANANVITAVTDFRRVEELGSLVDAKVAMDTLKADEVLFEWEIIKVYSAITVFSASTVENFNDVYSAITELSGATVSALTEFSASTVQNFNQVYSAITEFSGGTEHRFNEIEESLAELPEVIDNEEDFINNEELGKVIDALVIKDIILENEEVSSSSLNDINSRILELCGHTHNIKSFSTIITDDGNVNANDVNKSLRIEGESGITIASDNEAKSISLISTLTMVKRTPSESNVREEYSLVDTNGNTYGATIKVYKDNALQRAEMGHSGGTINANTGVVTDGPSTADEVLRIIYIDYQGRYTMVEVNLQSFITETEFKDGLIVDNHVVKVKIDTTSEPYLSVSQDGLKLSGLSNVLTSIKAFAKASDGINSVAASTSADTIGVIGIDYISTNLNGKNIEVKANVITDVDEFKEITVSGKIADAKMLCDVIKEDELIFSSAANDINVRILNLDNTVGKYYEFLQNTGETNTLTNIPSSASVIVCTVASNQSFTMADNPIDVREIKVMIHNTSSSQIVVTLPQSTPYVSMVGNSFVVPANSWGELSALCNKGTIFVRAV